MNELASLIAKKEGKKVSVSIGNVREVLSVMCQIWAERYYYEGTGFEIDLAITKNVCKKVDKIARAENKKKK